MHRSFVLFPYLATLSGGDEGVRTLDPLLAGQVLSQLSYTPIGVSVLLNDRYRSLKIEQQEIFPLLYANTLSPISFLLRIHERYAFALRKYGSKELCSLLTTFSIERR